MDQKYLDIVKYWVYDNRAPTEGDRLNMDIVIIEAVTIGNLLALSLGILIGIIILGILEFLIFK